MKMTLHIEGKPVELEGVSRGKGDLSFTLSGKQYAFRSQRLPDGSTVLEREVAPGVWQRVQASAWQGRGGVRHVQLGGLEAKISEKTSAASHAHGEAELSPRAPMPGVVLKILIKAGDRVEKGQPLAVMEAMKLQTTLSAGGNATVEKILVKVGEIIPEGTELVRLKEGK